MKVTFNEPKEPEAQVIMLVCLCKGVSDRKLLEEIHRGRRTVKELRECCGAGSDCGSCVRQIRDLLREHTVPHAARDPG